MTDQGFDKIRLAPSPPAPERDDTSQWMDWKATTVKALGPEVASQIQVLLSRNSISVAISGADTPELKVRVRQEPEGNYTQLYLASLHALNHIEKHVGRLASIEGVQRERWDVNFLTARQFTLFEWDDE
jgi:hypothetical protein